MLVLMVIIVFDRELGGVIRGYRRRRAASEASPHAHCARFEHMNQAQRLALDVERDQVCVAPIARDTAAPDQA